MTPGLTDPDAWLAQHASGGAQSPSDPDAWLAQRQPSSQTPPPVSAPGGPSWLPQSMRKYIGQVDTSRYEQAQREGWEPFQDIGQGAKTIVTAPDWEGRAEGAHQIVTGAGKAAAKFALPIAAANPVGAVTGAALGAGAALGTKAGLKAADIPQGYQDLGGDVAGLVAGGLGLKTGNWLQGKIPAFRAPDPDTTLYQALHPHIRQEIPDWKAMGETVRGDIKRASENTQQPINDIPSALKNTQGAKAENRAVVDLHMDPYRNAGFTSNGAPIADEIINAIPATLRARAQAGIPEAVAEVNRLAQEANVYRRQFTPDEVFGLSREFNAGLNNVFQRPTDAQHALVGKGGDITGLTAAARGARNLIRQDYGDDVADLQRRWGWLDDIETALQAKWKKVFGSPEENPPSPFDAASLKAGIPGKIEKGDIPGAKALWRGGKTNSLLKDTFDNTEPGWPLPTPQPSGMPGVGGMPRAQGPARQLPPATPQIPPRSGGYVSSTGMPPGPQQNVWQGIGAPRQLPAGSPTQGQGVIQVPPAGAGWSGPSAGATSMSYRQTPFSPREAAAPADTSGVSYYGPNPLGGSTSFVRKGPSPFGSERGSFSNRPSVEPETAPTGDSLAVRMGKQIWNTLNPTKIGDPNTFSRIQARDVLHHSTNLDAGESILQEGAIVPKRYTDKFLNWGTETQPDIAGQRVGFTGPRTSLSRGQRVGDPITFEVDPSYVKQPKPVQGLPGRKATGKFEFETGTQEPIPAEGIKNVLINTPRANEMYGDAADRIMRIKDLATQRGIPVIEGTESELLSRRPLGMQGPMRPISTVEGAQ